MVRVLDVDEHAFAVLLGKSADYGIRELGLTAIADADLVKVGPKGYIHGWIFVGAPGVGTLVEHARHGRGKVTHLDEHGHVHVDFGGGKRHSFEHAGGEGPGHLAARAKGTDRFSTHLDAATAANRRGDHAEAARQYRQAAETATHPRLASEMHQRADVAQAKIPGIRPSTATEFARTDISGALRSHTQEHHDFPDTAARLDALSEGLRSGDVKVPDAANRLDRIVADHAATHGTDNHTHARLSMMARDIRADPRTGQLMKPAPKPRTPRKPKVEPAVPEPAKDAGTAVNERVYAADLKPGDKIHVSRGGGKKYTPHDPSVSSRRPRVATITSIGRDPSARGEANLRAETDFGDIGRLSPGTRVTRVHRAPEAPPAPRPARTPEPELTAEHHSARARELQAQADRELAAAGTRMGRMDTEGVVVPRQPTLRENQRVRQHMNEAERLRLEAASHSLRAGLAHDRTATDVVAERDAARQARDNAKEVRRLTALATGARVSGRHDEANRHLEAAAALAPDEATRQTLLTSRHSGSFRETPADTHARLMDAARRGGPKAVRNELTDPRHPLTDEHLRQVQQITGSDPVVADALRAEGNRRGISTTAPTGHDVLAAELHAMPTRAAARERLSGMKKSELDALADHLQVGYRGRNKKDLVEILADGTVGTRLTSSAFHGGMAGPPKGDAPRVAGQTARSSEPLLSNSWGGFGEVSYHPDGATGRAIDDLGEDAHVEVNGHALANELGRIATDAHAGRTSSSEAIDRIRQVGRQLPAGSTARRKVERLATALDSPATAAPTLPAGVPAPLHDLARALHDIPGGRRDPREQRGLHEIAERFAAGNLGGGALIREVRNLGHRRHESDMAHVDTGRAVRDAAAQLEDMQRQDRTSLYPAREQGAGSGDMLRAASSRAEARSRLAGMTKPQLTQLALDLGASVRAGNKDQLIDDLVEWAVGRRLDAEAMSRIGQVR